MHLPTVQGAAKRCSQDTAPGQASERDVIYREAGSLEVQHKDMSWTTRAYKVSIWLLLGRALRREEEKMGRELPSAGHRKKEES